jgi:DEAD/DEAH box helicase domain-containing protein
VEQSLQIGERRPIGYGGSVQEIREPAGVATFGECALAPPLAEVLARRGIGRLYAHQAETIEAVRAGRSVILCAPTASGKTEAYLVAAVEAALQGRRSLLLFPTKALARDQLARFAELEPLGLRAAVYDGDTPEKERRRIRQDVPHFILTNPDMLHLMLLSSRSFRAVWETLGLLVLDDVHVYTGAFGGHVAQILKRLRRMCAVRGSRLQVVACSATIHNPAEFALGLLSQRLNVIRGEARRSPVRHRIVNPPYIGTDRRESYLTRTLRIVEELLEEGRGKILVFANAHVSAEALGAMASERGVGGVAVYRAGLLDRERRELEARFRGGELRVLVTTSALELGIDVGAVDAVVLAGYPGSATRVRQRIGRAGRKGQEALAVLVARDNPLDQYFVDHPYEYVAGEPESAYVHAQSPEIARPHVVAFVRDLPDEAEWIERFFNDGEALLAQVVAEGLVTQRDRDGRWIPTREGIARVFHLNVRGAAARVRILDLERDEVIGNRERHQAMLELFSGAIYLHGGRRYRVMFLDLERGVAGVRPAADANVRTTPLFDREAEVVEQLAARTCHDAPLAFGRIRITTTVHGYLRRDLYRGTILDRRELADPLSFELDTQGLWMDFPHRVNAGVRFAEGLHAVEHTSIHMLPVVTGADPTETGGLSYPAGRMYVYDGFPGGSGLTRVAHERFEEVLAKALDRLAQCGCERGCPGCILDPQCGNANEYLDKAAGREILERLLEAERELPGVGPSPLGPG